VKARGGRQISRLWAVAAGCIAAAVPARADLVARGLADDWVGPPTIHSPALFGVRPGSPVLYTIRATGEEPIRYFAESLPRGTVLDPATGSITGIITQRGAFECSLGATNRLGTARQKLSLVVGDRISLTPALGWNSWNCWGDAVDQDKVLRAAHAMVATGLSRHGWTYINIDDSWQAPRVRGGPLRSNSKFPDLAGLCAEIHRLGLKAGIYSTPWITSYAGYPGGSADDPDGAWVKTEDPAKNWRMGRHGFALTDARQWARWGFDYLKYDWNPIDVESVRAMSAALRHSGRDLVFSLSNTAPFEHAAEFAALANSWRTTGDIFDKWVMRGKFWQHGVSEIGFNQDRWAPYAGPGHWNDPDMLVLGTLGWGLQLHPTHLSPEEQRSHFSLWCLLSAPLLLGCDLEHLDPFTYSLLSNDEILAVNQDPLGQPAVRVATAGPIDFYFRRMADGAGVLGVFNRDSQEQTFVFTKLSYLGFAHGAAQVRDLWNHAPQADVTGLPDGALSGTVPSHGVRVYRINARAEPAAARLP
jgi:alpha-galactosidase